MNHEKILIREDKSKVKICVNILIPFGKNIEYRVDVYFCPKNNRLYQSIFSGDEWDYRRLNMEGKKKWVLNKQLGFVSSEEILSAKIELWEKIKPTS